MSGITNKLVLATFAAFLAMGTVTTTTFAETQKLIITPQNPSGARLGISGKYTYKDGVEGVLVYRDNSKRTLRVVLPNGKTVNAKFRVGYDIITSINGMQVFDARDVLNALHYGTNSLEVYDSYSKSWHSARVTIR
ncbi:MAG TPA: hypothetical protein DD473_24465 [Planctomycetaceae bacterium]|nr:hypothetical protein [Planctomycetaceae bacterium]|tara:strand:+ start:1428 stop:1835 length:408 start_codon:yes stop_codon:yes gene_type:complete